MTVIRVFFLHVATGIKFKLYSFTLSTILAAKHSCKDSIASGHPITDAT